MRPQARAPLIGLAVVVALGCAAPLLAPHDPMALSLAGALSPPSSQHWLGTDPDGADLLSRLLTGSRISILIGLGTVLLTGVVGTLLGLLAGTLRGRIDQALTFFTDALMGFPGLLLPLAISAMLEDRGPGSLILAMSATGWLGVFRVVRTQAWVLSEAEFVQAARAQGIPNGRIIWRYLTPHVLTPVLVQASFGMSHAILGEAGLSFLGLGLPVGTPSWGAMLSQGRNYLLVAPHLSLYPGMVIALLVFSLNLLGERLRAGLDPRSGAGTASG